MSTRSRVLMVYLEPAPYIVGLVNAIRAIWPGEIDVLFAQLALSQPWGYQVQGPAEAVLPAKPVAAIAHINRALAHKEYGLIHLAGWGHTILLATLLLGSARRIPVTIETDTPITEGLPAWKRLVKACLYRPIFKLPIAFLPAGSRQVEYLRRYGVEEARIHIARMTVDVGRILAYSTSVNPDVRRSALRRYGIPEKSSTILYLGRLEPHKGLLDLFNAFDLLKQQINCVSLLVAGDGSLAPLVRERASPARSIYYAGRLSGESVLEAYAISDIFVLPSHFEPWGLVVNEAMASGLPIIASNRVGCADDLIEQERTGLLVPPGSPHALFEAMRTLVTDACMRRRMASEARRVIADWTLENAAKTTAHVWDRSLRCAGSS